MPLRGNSLKNGGKPIKASWNPPLCFWHESDKQCPWEEQSDEANLKAIKMRLLRLRLAMTTCRNCQKGGCGQGWERLQNMLRMLIQRLNLIRNLYIWTLLRLTIASKK